METPRQNTDPYGQLEAGLRKLGLSSFFSVEAEESYGQPVFLVKPKASSGQFLFQMTINPDDEFEVLFNFSNYYVRKIISLNIDDHPADLETTWEILSQALAFEAEVLEANQIACDPAKALAVRVIFAGIQYDYLTPYLSLKFNPEEIVSLLLRSIPLEEVHKHDGLPFEWLMKILEVEELED